MECEPPLMGKNMRPLQSCERFPPLRVPKGGSHQSWGKTCFLPGRVLGWLAPSIAARWAQDSWTKKYDSFPQGPPKGGSLNHVKLGPALMGEENRKFPSRDSAYGPSPHSHGIGTATRGKKHARVRQEKPRADPLNPSALGAALRGEKIREFPLRTAPSIA
jgi:hypothetical protein